MNKWQRIKEFSLGLVTILGSLLLILSPVEGYTLVTLILSISLVLYGIRRVVFYITMARHMVGGKSEFYRGIILLDLGLFAYSLVDVPKLFVICYLLVGHGFAGVVDVLKAFEARKIESPSWRISMLYGAGNLILAILALACAMHPEGQWLSVELYSLGLLYSGVTRIAMSLRKTAIIYVQ